jgi:hypothetical protein
MLGKAGPGHELPDLQWTNRITDRIGSTNKNKARPGGAIENGVYSIEEGAVLYISTRRSHGRFERRCCHQAILRIFPEITYIRTVGNFTLL